MEEARRSRGRGGRRRVSKRVKGESNGQKDQGQACQGWWKVGWHRVRILNRVACEMARVVTLGEVVCVDGSLGAEG